MSTGDCLAAAILFGGRGQRLGGIDKSALKIEDTSIIDRLLRVLRAVTPHVFAVGDRYGAASAAGISVVDDIWPDAGPLAGIYTAIVNSPCPRTLVVGCDMPFLTEAFLQHLADLSQTSAGAVIMPRSGNGYEPLCAIYPRESAAAIRERLERGERKAARPPEGVQVVEVGPGEVAMHDPNGVLFVNVNTPHDYEKARRHGARRRD